MGAAYSADTVVLIHIGGLIGGPDKEMISSKGNQEKNRAEENKAPKRGPQKVIRPRRC
jgi:hypothetical protein